MIETAAGGRPHAIDKIRNHAFIMIDHMIVMLSSCLNTNSSYDNVAEELG